MKYKAVMEDAPERIFAMAEREQRHSHRMNLLSVILIGSGQFLGFIIIFLAILAGAFLIYTGKTLEGFGAFLTGVGVLLGGGYLAKKNPPKA